MTVDSGPVFDRAVDQLGVIADRLSIPYDEVRAARNTRGLLS